MLARRLRLHRSGPDKPLNDVEGSEPVPRPRRLSGHRRLARIFPRHLGSFRPMCRDHVARKVDAPLRFIDRRGRRCRHVTAAA